MSQQALLDQLETDGSDVLPVCLPPKSCVVEHISRLSSSKRNKSGHRKLLWLFCSHPTCCWNFAFVFGYVGTCPAWQCKLGPQHKQDFIFNGTREIFFWYFNHLNALENLSNKVAGNQPPLKIVRTEGHWHYKSINYRVIQLIQLILTWIPYHDLCAVCMAHISFDNDPSELQFSSNLHTQCLATWLIMKSIVLQLSFQTFLSNVPKKSPQGRGVVKFHQ